MDAYLGNAYGLTLAGSQRCDGMEHPQLQDLVQPLISPRGIVVATVCLLDYLPRELTADQVVRMDQPPGWSWRSTICAGRSPR